MCTSTTRATTTSSTGSRASTTATASTTTTTVPAEYRTVTKTVLKTPAATREIAIPAEYKTLTKTVLVKKGGFTEWREVLCGSSSSSSYIGSVRQVQSALKTRGYDPGPIDGVMGSKTRAALLKYQKDNGLPEGQLDVETLKSLGVN